MCEGLAAVDGAVLSPKSQLYESGSPSGSDEPVLVRQEGKTSIPWGATIGIRPLMENMHRFDEKGVPIR